VNAALAALSAERLLVLASFAIVALWTPGPNNLLLARSGATFGFWRTVPHGLGVAFGFAVMLFAVALGLGEVFQAQPLFREGLRFVGVAVMLYLSWKIASSRWRHAEGKSERPFRILEAVLFQWINPKAWAMIVGTSAIFVTGSHPMFESAVCALVFAVLGLTSASGWTLFGVGIGRALNSDLRKRAFNVGMGILLAITALALVFDDLAFSPPV